MSKILKNFSHNTLSNFPIKKCIRMFNPLRRSNCSALIPPGSPGVRVKICVIKEGVALEDEVKRGQGTLK